MAKKRKPDIAKRRVHIPARHWTAVSLKAFDALHQFRLLNAALVYLVLYHHAWHRKSKRVRASLRQMADWTGLDYRVVQKCLKYLKWRRFILQVSPGTLHSADDLPIWRVPATQFDMTTEGWVPVPSFIFTHYMRAHPHCVLLVILLSLQNIHGENQSWASAESLGQMLHWKERRVYEALKLMSNQKDWGKLGTKLPYPVLVTQQAKRKKKSRRFQVRAVYYHRENKKDRPNLYLTEEFSAALGLNVKTTPTDAGSDMAGS